MNARDFGGNRHAAAERALRHREHVGAVREQRRHVPVEEKFAVVGLKAALKEPVVGRTRPRVDAAGVGRRCAPLRMPRVRRRRLQALRQKVVVHHEIAIAAVVQIVEKCANVLLFSVLYLKTNK